MPHDPERVAEVGAWLWKAREDLRAGHFELTARPPLSADVVFHAQQAVEKAIKAFLSWHDRPFRRTHDLVELGEAAVEIDPSLEPALRPAAPLTEYAWRFRYPGDPDQPPEEEAQEAMRVASAALREIEARLPRELSKE